MSVDSSRASSGGMDRLGDAFHPLSQRLFDTDGDFVGNLERKLGEARIPQTVELYLSKSLAFGVIAGAILWVLGTLLGLGLITFVITEPPILLGLPAPEPYLSIMNWLKLPLLIFFSGLVFGSIGFGVGFGGMVAKPYLEAGERKREINVLLSDSVSFMYALSVGGLNQLEILEAMAQADDTYGEVAQEFQSIVLETKYFDTDYRTAVRTQAMQTPSDGLSQLLTDMLSIINSGGDMERFLQDQKEKHMRTSKQEQETVLETMELFGEMYMTLSLFPLLLIIILVIMSMLEDAQNALLYGTVYGLIPMIGIGFLVLVSTVVPDEVGDGYLRTDDKKTLDRDSGMFHLGLATSYAGTFSVFDQVKSREGRKVTMEILRQPHLFFRDHPLAVLAITFPMSLVLVFLSVSSGAAPLSVERMIQAPIRGTFLWVYMPLYINLVPLTIFYEWNMRSRRAITNNLSDNLRKLSSANDTGMTLLESLKVVADTSSGKLANEFRVMYAKVNYGTSLRTALREFNNDYHIPRLARTVKLITKAQEASSQITQVLSTAAQSSENQDDIDRDRRSRTRMQMVIIIMTYVTLLGVMALLKVEFLDTMAGLVDQAGSADGGAPGAGGGFGGGIDVDELTMLFFHAVTLQGIISGVIAGYIREVSVLASLKFVVVLPTLALAVFIFI